MTAPRIETLRRRVQEMEALGYVVRTIRADGSLEVAKRDDTAKAAPQGAEPREW